MTQTRLTRYPNRPILPLLLTCECYAVVADGTSGEDENTLLAKALPTETTMKDSIKEPLQDQDSPNNKKEIQKLEKHNYPLLPEEPTGDRSLLCRVGVRLPDGRRLQRSFLRSDPIQVSLVDFDFTPLTFFTGFLKMMIPTLQLFAFFSYCGHFAMQIWRVAMESGFG